MAALSSTSDSLIGSLCREAEWIRSRSTQLSRLIQGCRDAALSRRLKLESQTLSDRRHELLGVAQRWRLGKQNLDALTLDFLIELCRRD